MTTKLNVSSIFLVVLAIFMVIFSVQAKANEYHQLKETKLSAFLHVYLDGPNATDLPLVGFPGKLWRYDQFGTVYLMDDLLTEGPEPTSPKLGRVEATGVIVSLDAQNILISGSLVFTNEAYNGSTIQILGVVNQYSVIQEYGVTSGTGIFRYATGYVVWEQLSYDASLSYSLLRVNATIRLLRYQDGCTALINCMPECSSSV